MTFLTGRFLLKHDAADNVQSVLGNEEAASEKTQRGNTLLDSY